MAADRQATLVWRSFEKGAPPLSRLADPPRHLLRLYIQQPIMHHSSKTTMRSTGVFAHRGVTLEHMASQAQVLGRSKNPNTWGVMAVARPSGLQQVNEASVSHPSPQFLRCLPNPYFELKMPNGKKSMLPSVLAML